MQTRFVFQAVIVIGLSGLLFAEEAITLSGKRVILNEDGTWEYKKTQDPNEVKFRGVEWGCSVEDIKKTIPDEPAYDGKDGLMYEDKISGYAVYCVFVTAKGQFVRGRHAFTEEHSNDNQFIWDFESLGKLLREKYGEPNDHGEIWIDDTFKEYSRNRGMDIASGRLRLATEWNIGQVTINHALTGDNYEIHHFIEYTHKAMSQLEIAAQKEEDKAKL